jgi:glucose-6-phosphate-specific signal transduction histidine kinase
MKIITLCGSLKFKKEMMEIAEKMALDGNCVLTPVYPVLENYKRTDRQLELLKEAHFKKIELSDSILVVNINNYIGNSTNLEIEYAKKLGKEIIYYIDLI